LIHRQGRLTFALSIQPNAWKPSNPLIAGQHKGTAVGGSSRAVRDANGKKRALTDTASPADGLDATAFLHCQDTAALV